MQVGKHQTRSQRSISVPYRLLFAYLLPNPMQRCDHRRQFGIFRQDQRIYVWTRNPAANRKLALETNHCVETLTAEINLDVQRLGLEISKRTSQLTADGSGRFTHNYVRSDLGPIVDNCLVPHRQCKIFDTQRSPKPRVLRCSEISDTLRSLMHRDLRNS